MKSLAVYIHWPYCQSKCPYCDFNSHVAASHDHAAWREAYQKEIGHYAALLKNRVVTSVFFGGGTPSLMEPATVASVLDDIARAWPLDPACEITLEANPNSVEAQKFIDFKAAGINRLSLGIQSLYPKGLKFLGRLHDDSQARSAIALAAKTFSRFSFDLIYARADQTEQSWEKELKEALAHNSAHLSLYQLTIEPNTQFYTLHNRGENLIAPDERAARMFEQTQNIMEQAGLPAYEISNHARQGQESRHNLTYWHYDDYIGIGPGAHGRFSIADDKNQRHATENHKTPDVWLRHVAQHGHGQRLMDEIDLETAQREALMMNLRLRKGIIKKDWHSKFRVELVDYLNSDKKTHLMQEGYLSETEDYLQATAAGLQRLNAVLSYLLN